MIKKTHIARMSEAELAALAAKAPEGFTAIIEHGTLVFVADWLLEEIAPSERAELVIVGRAH